MTSKPGTLEDRVKEIKRKMSDYNPPSLLIKEAATLINDLLASLRIYREIEKENRGKQNETLSSGSERKP